MGKGGHSNDTHWPWLKVLPRWEKHNSDMKALHYMTLDTSNFDYIAKLRDKSRDESDVLRVCFPTENILLAAFIVQNWECDIWSLVRNNPWLLPHCFRVAQDYSCGGIAMVLSNDGVFSVSVAIHNLNHWWPIVI